MAHILIIDDDENIRHFLGELLETAGHRVSLAGDGEAGARHYRVRPFDLVVTDLEMPVRGGLEVIEELKADFPRIRIVAVTAASEDRVDRALELGADYVFLKPFKVGEFLEAIQKLIADPHSQA